MTNLFSKIKKFFNSSQQPNGDKNFSSFGSSLPRKAGEVGNKSNSTKSDTSSIVRGTRK